MTAHDTLRAYLNDTGLAQHAFARRVGVDQSVISRIVAGKVRPSLDLAFRIERETGGAVGAIGWAHLDIPKQQPARAG